MTKESNGPDIDSKFINFFRATLAKMYGIGALKKEFIDHKFWDSWPKRFYNIRAYDTTKELQDELPKQRDERVQEGQEEEEEEEEVVQLPKKV